MYTPQVFDPFMSYKIFISYLIRKWGEDTPFRHVGSHLDQICPQLRHPSPLSKSLSSFSSTVIDSLQTHPGSALPCSPSSFPGTQITILCSNTDAIMDLVIYFRVCDGGLREKKVYRVRISSGRHSFVHKESNGMIFFRKPRDRNDNYLYTALREQNSAHESPAPNR